MYISLWALGGTLFTLIIMFKEAKKDAYDDGYRKGREDLEVEQGTEARH